MRLLAIQLLWEIGGTLQWQSSIECFLLLLIEFFSDGWPLRNHTVTLLADIFKIGPAAAILMVFGVGELFRGECFERFSDLYHVLFVAFVLLALSEDLRRGGAVLRWDSYVVDLSIIQVLLVLHWNCKLMIKNI